MNAVAGATTLAELASALGYPVEEASIVAELKAGSEPAYAWLIAHYHQPVYSLVYRVVNDGADAADTTQEVFLKVFRGIKRFNGQSSLKTWIYRIAVHEACNRKRWWRRHKSREVPLEAPVNEQTEHTGYSGEESLEDGSPSPFEQLATLEVRERVERELSRIAEPFRTTVILRDIEELSYEEIAEVMQVSLGTVKSRLTRGREVLKQRLAKCLSAPASAKAALSAGPREEFRLSEGEANEKRGLGPRQQAVEVHS